MTVPFEFAPSPAQDDVWGPLVIKDLGVDLDGWWMGWCPLHDKERDPKKVSAQFNFSRGTMRCEARPSCIDPKLSMSLQNVLVILAKQVING